MTIRKVPFDYAWLWPWASFKIAKRNYPLALGISFILVMMYFVTKLPLLGGAIYAFLQILISTGLLFIAKDWIEDKKPSVEKIFCVFNDFELFRSVFPLAIFNMLLSLVSAGLLVLAQKMPPLALPAYLLAVVTTIASMFIMAYSIPIIVFKKTSTLESINLSIAAMWKNIGTEIVLLLVLLFGFILSLVALVLPVFFFYLPALIPFWYIKYLTIFENFDLNNIIEEKVSVNAPEANAADESQLSNSND